MSEPSRLPAPSRAALSLARSVTATWWYTASSVIFVHLMVVMVWLVPTLLLPRAWPVAVGAVLFAAGSALSLASAVALLIAYRHTTTGDDEGRWWPPSALVWAGLAAAVAGSALIGIAARSALIGVALFVYALCLLRWPPGLRVRLLVLSVVVLCVIWAVEGARLVEVPDETQVTFAVFAPVTAVALPMTAVLTLWWWDVVVELDRARIAEGRLAAVQERLRLAGDLHDLQGHHLQVIALQLELAERMLPRDPEAAAEQVHLARASVDAARQGTRELAGRFRGVPLPDELANAADLLRAAGIPVELDVAPDAGDAPADVLGPVVRECTTNVLKHGGGAWAHLSLAHTDGAWVLRVANDPRHEPSVLGAGSGLAGIGERVRAVGGDIRTVSGDAFEVIVTVPAATKGEIA